MIYASTEQQYMAAYNTLNFPLVKDYFYRNWHDLDTRKQWAAYHTNNFQNYLTRTTNRVESINHKLKTVITTYGTLHTFFKETMQCVESLNVERDHRTIASIQRNPIRSTNETETDFKYREVLTNFAFIQFRDEKAKIDAVSITAEIVDGSMALKSHSSSTIVCITNGKTCTCPFYKGMSLPCRHIMFFVERKQLETFLPNLCNKRWLKSHLPGDLIGSDSRTATILSQNQKYHQASKMVEKIAEKPIGLFETYMRAMKDCLTAIENHQLQLNI